MQTLEQTSVLLEDANKQYAEGDFCTAVLTLLRAARLENAAASDVECVFDRLAAIACEQGLYRSAAHWYMQVLQSKAARMTASDPQLTDAIRNYRVLLALSQSGDTARLS